MKKKFPKPNEHGTYPSERAETLSYTNNRTRANIELLQIGPDVWINAIDVQLSNCGMGEPLSNHDPHPTRDGALAAAVKRIMCYTEHNAAPDALQVKRWAEGRLQMTLF